MNERYKIKHKIGAGGMADVYLARDIILERDVAIKSLRMEYANDQEFIARFDREAQSATSLSHPNVVSIYDVGEEDHLLYMVMEYVDGMTLKEYIQRFGPIDVGEALDIMKQISSAITHAHANDIVHRDIKPQNILINNLGQAKVTDFGIAMALSATSLTQTNSILGSVHYLSPEQARGGMATKKSDIYSLGIVLFEMLTGRLPFSGQSPVSIALKHLQSDTPSVRKFNPEIPQSVENIVLKATAKNPFHRYESIYELEDAIETALHPNKINEKAYTPPVEVGEETKAIPIITDQQLESNYDQETLVLRPNETTVNYPEENNKQKVKKVTKNTTSKKKTSKKKPKKEKKGKKKWLIIFSVLFIILASGITALFIFPGFLQPSDVTIPDIIEMESDEATDMLEELNLVVEEESVFSEDIDEGLVVRTNPNPGRTVKEETVVTLFVSEGKERVVFDDYVGRDFSQVETLLDREGFNDIITYEKYSDRPVGEIIRQISPNPDDEVIPGETEVIFEISNGPEPVSLTDLTGMTEEDAIAYLKDENLNPKVSSEHSDTVAEGLVIRQSPSTGSNIGDGETVEIVISLGPEEIEPGPQSQIIKYTVPYEPKEQETDDGEPGDDQDTEPQEPAEQNVKIYIKDANKDFSVPHIDEVITENTTFTFTVVINPGSSAEYRIVRDDEEIVREEVNYEEQEGE
ncbi:Stk1 family PASTA domain-containing Ser/Thr kinase [Oceanobacillus bengalensis]|uniref:Stk1 family PASTA domain-containing Ser/Thr kinase n=1 Tax=Oceanobacillus bengalensis TaxID=1435466 RepID=UPI00362D5F6E